MGQRGKWSSRGLGLEGLKGCGQGTGEAGDKKGTEDQRAPWEMMGGLSGGAPGSSGEVHPLDSGEKVEGQPLREGCREAAYFGKSQVPGRWEVKRNSLK